MFLIFHQKMTDSDEEIYKIEESFKITFLLYGDVTEEFVETVLRPNLLAQTSSLYFFTWTLDDALADLKTQYRDEFREFPNEVAKIEGCLLHLASVEDGLILSGPLENVKIEEINQLCRKHGKESKEVLVFEQGGGLPILGAYSTYDSMAAAENMVKARMGFPDVPDGGAIVVEVASLPMLSLR